MMWNRTLKIRVNWPIRSLVSCFVKYYRIGLQHLKYLPGTSISVISETRFNLGIYDNFYRSQGKVMFSEGSVCSQVRGVG